MSDTDVSGKKEFESAFSLFGKSKKIVMDNLSVFAMLYAIPLLFQLFNILGSDKTNDDNKGSFVDSISSLSGAGMATLVGAGVLLAVISVIVSIYIQAMLYIAELEASQGKKPVFGDLFNKAKKYWLNLFGLGIVIGLMFVGGLLLLIVPGLIVLRRYFLAPFYMIDKELSIGDAMKQSATDSKAASGSIWGLIGVSFLIGLISVVPVFGWALSFVLSVLYSVAPALRYREIKHKA